MDIANEQLGLKIIKTGLRALLMAAARTLREKGEKPTASMILELVKHQTKGLLETENLTEIMKEIAKNKEKNKN